MSEGSLHVPVPQPSGHDGSGNDSDSPNPRGGKPRSGLRPHPAQGNTGQRSRSVQSIHPSSPSNNERAEGGGHHRSRSWWGQSNTAGPGAPEDKTVTVEHKMVKPGVYSTWVRILSPDVSLSHLAAVLARCEESSTGTIHVYLREKFLSRRAVQQLRAQGYKFHHYVEETQCFVYAKQPGNDDSELLNATSKETIVGLVLSPDEKQVLMLWEGGKWTFLSARVSTREGMVDALKRIVASEADMQLDAAFKSMLLGGWNHKAAKVDCVNDLCLCFSVRVAAKDFKAETGKPRVRWFDISELMQLLDLVDAQFKQMGCAPKLGAAIEHPPGNVFSHIALRWVRQFTKGEGCAINDVAGRTVFCQV